MSETQKDAPAVTANALPLPLRPYLSERPPASALPLNLVPYSHVEPLPPAPRRMQGAAACMQSVISTAFSVTNCLNSRRNGMSVADWYDTKYDEAKSVAGCQRFSSVGFIALANCAEAKISDVVPLRYCQASNIKNMVLLGNCRRPILTPTINYKRCTDVASAPVVSYQRCSKPYVQPVVSYQRCIKYSKASAQIADQYSERVPPAVPVPCRYYPIPEPPPPKPSFSCRPRPPSNALPLALTRKRRPIPSSALPLPLMCWHDELPPVIPSLRSYLVHNVITATVGGIAVDLLDFEVKTYMDSFCWHGEVELTKRDYTRIKHKLDVEHGDEPLITVTTNNFTFAFIAEMQTRSRKFEQHTYKLSGRSVTARLGADYAKAQAGLLTQDNYASQIVNQQLANLPFSVAEWSIPDWLIPANEYSVTGKTPLAVIAEIAKTAGGFVCSDANGTGLSLKPRWRVPAWQVATATPDVVLPVDVMFVIDDTRRPNPRHNVVTVMSNVAGGHVYRALQGRDREAPTQNHALYTDRDVIIAAGAKLLSDSGTHGHYTLKSRWASKYDIPLAEPGQIWQIGDPEGAWRGVVTGVSVSIEQDNGAPCVYQTVNIDRYLDD